MEEVKKNYLMAITVIITLIIIMYGSLIFFPRGNALERGAEEIAEELIEKNFGLKVDLPE